MSLEIQINNSIILNVLSFTARSSLTTISNSFTLLLSPGKNATAKQSNLNFKPGETVTILVDGQPVINGFVDALQVRYSKGQHTIELVGRDRTADFIDSSVAEINVATPIEFEQLLRITLAAMGLNQIKIINLLPEADDLKIKVTQDIVSEIGQTGFEFIDQYARLKQVLLQGDGAGNILMTRGGVGKRINTALVNVPGMPENNIIHATLVQDRSDRFNKYICKSQEDFASEGLDKEPADSIDNSGLATDSKIRKGRNFIFEAEENSEPQECVNRAAWEANLRRAKEIKFTVTVPGFSFEERDSSALLWQPNMLVPVVDIFSNISSVMLIESVFYRLTDTQGRSTEITLVRPDSYTVQAEQDATSARTALIGKEDG